MYLAFRFAITCPVYMRINWTNFKQLIMSIEETKQAIGQIEKSIDQASDVLDIESFSNYCDSAYTLIAYWRKIQQTLKEEQ